MITLSNDLFEKCFGDEAILKYLEMGKDAFIAGDRQALLGVIFLCARYQAVIPDWAADAILKAEDDIESGVACDPNEVFGWSGKRKEQNERAKLWRQQELAPKVLGHMQNDRLDGGGLNADIDLQRIADELNISRRDVEDIYKHRGQFIKTLPKGNTSAGVFLFGMGKVEQPRRQGRPILRDQILSLDTKPKTPVSD